jgi:hypothetical protein
MSDSQFEEILENCPLSQWEKDELRSEKDRTLYYRKHIFWHRLGEMKTAAGESHIYLLRNGIFLSVDLRTKFSALDALVWDALVEHQLNAEHEETPRETDKAKTLRMNGPELLTGLEADVRGRLWNSQDAAL